MLYVEPVYVKSNQDENAYPLLQRVLLSYGEGDQNVVLAPTLEEGIEQLIATGRGQDPTPPPDDEQEPPAGDETPQPNVPPSLAEAADRVEAAIAEVRAAQASGDPARWGRAIVALDEAMRGFEAAQRAATGAGPSAGPSPPAGSPTATPPTPSPGPSG
jgi:uncharacterized membrane protein (UPF0182 family)